MGLLCSNTRIMELISNKVKAIELICNIDLILSDIGSTLKRVKINIDYV